MPELPAPSDKLDRAAIQDLIAQYMNAHPPEGGKPPTDDQVMAIAQPLIDNWLASHPAPAGRDATPEQIAAAVAEWMRVHPPEAGEDGEDGKDATQEQIAAAVQAYLQANPPAAGEDGKDATAEQIAAAVSDYLNANPPASGRPPTAQEIADAVAVYIQTHPPADGKSVELQFANDFVQWRQVGSSVWNNLVAKSALMGTKGTDGTNGTNGTNGLNGVDGKSVELQVTATAIQWRQVGGNWADLVLLSALKGQKGDTGPAGQTLLANINITETASLAITIGLFEGRYTCPGAVVGERYTAYIRSHKLNGAAQATAGKPSGFGIFAVDCMVAGTVNVQYQRPAVALSVPPGKYELFTDIVKVNVS